MIIMIIILKLYFSRSVEAPPQVYHFGVGAWLSEHLDLERKDSNDIPQEAWHAFSILSIMFMALKGSLKGP